MYYLIKKDIDKMDFSWIINDPHFLNKDKKILTIYSSFEQYFGETERFRSLCRNPKVNLPKPNIEKTPDTKEKWKEFRSTGLLWFINTILHTFGYAIKYKVDRETGDLLDVYPDRVKFRGFSEELNTKGYIKVSQYMRDNADELLKEAKDE